LELLWPRRSRLKELLSRSSTPQEKKAKELGYLAHLLRHPAVEFHVLDLAGGNC
jgi:hypothetical protein